MNPALPHSVLLTADAVGGVWHYAIALARLLAPVADVTLAVVGPPPSTQQRGEAARIRGLRLEVFEGRLEWMPDPWTDVDRTGEWLLGLERRLRPAIVHLNQYAFGALPFEAPVLVVAHSCVGSWWRAVKGCAAPAPWDPYRRRVRAGLHGADLVAAPGAEMLRALATEYGFHGPGIVIANGCDPGLWRPAAKRPRILAAGRWWDEAKNIAALAAVAPTLDWPLEVAGDAVPYGSDPTRPDQAPSALRFLGRLEETMLAENLSSTSIFVHPALYEPFGLAVLQAALSECALVLGDIPSLRRLWRDAALFVPPRDHDALASTLQQLVASPDRRHALGRRARARALHFDTQRLAHRTLKAYRITERNHNKEPLCAS